MSCRRRWSWTMLAAVAFVATESKSQLQPTPVKPDSDRVIAIDVLLVPDVTMWEKAVAANARLRENYPQCYTLGADQLPHITLVHRYVREKDLRAIEAAVANVLAANNPLPWRLTATGIEHGVWAGVAITTIVVERAPELDATDVRSDSSDALPAPEGTDRRRNTFELQRELRYQAAGGSVICGTRVVYILAPRKYADTDGRNSK